MLGDREPPGDRLDKNLLKMEVSSANIARAVDQEGDVSGNRDIGDTCKKARVIYHVIKNKLEVAMLLLDFIRSLSLNSNLQSP